VRVLVCGWGGKEVEGARGGFFIYSHRRRSSSGQVIGTTAGDGSIPGQRAHHSRYGDAYRKGGCDGRALSER
jgi:hypothetical protein